jgi:PAS domain S-box-containing protein
MIGVPRIVVVDDAAEVRTLVRSRLRLSGRFDIVGEGATGQDAIDLARRLRPDLMLLDVSMPVMDGLEALPQVKSIAPTTRIVMYSGLPERGLPDRCRALGADTFLAKSATFETLVDDLVAVMERDEGERSPRETEAVLRLLIEAVQDYAIFMLDPAGRVASWNPGAQRSKGWTAEEIIGQHFRVFYPSERQEERHPERELELALRDGRYEEEGWRVRKDGSRFWAHVTITAVRDHDGELVGFGKVTRDDTERRDASSRLEEANELLRQAAEEQSQFLGMTAHELRSPIGVLGGSAKMLRDHWSELVGEERDEMLDGMIGSVDRLQRLLADLLTTSRIHSAALTLEVRELDLAEALGGIVQAVGLSAPTGALRLGPVPSIGVLADPGRLSQMVENLVDNALRHGAPPVEIDVETHPPHLRIVVRDAGQGIPTAMRDRLFERFATGRSQGGTGLGLYIVRELARAQGGDADYRSGDHAFVITLPMAGPG